MKKQYLSIVLRNQFNLFYRFGYTFIPKSLLIEFDGSINDGIKESIREQFTKVTPFEYDEEYLILHLEIESTNKSDFIQFGIQNVISIYPLSRQAKVSIESKIDQRIQLAEPIFETILPKITTEIRKKEVEKAISALWKICKIEKSVKEYEDKIGLEYIFNGLEDRNCGKPADKILNGNYWEYLIAYDRYDYFPKSTLGYFYDAGQVFAYSNGQPTFEGSKIHQFLEGLNSANPSAKMPDIIKSLEMEEQPSSYVSKTKINGIKQYIVAPLYLMLRDEIRELDDISQTNLFKNLTYLKKFEDSFNYVVILLGAFFGFRKFYDIYYDSLNLRFYKNFRNGQDVQAPKQIEATSNSDKSVDTNIPIENQSKDKLIETTGEERVSGIISVQNLSAKEKQDQEIQKIIEEILDDPKSASGVKLSDIQSKIKEQTHQTPHISTIKDFIRKMDGVEIFKNKPSTARRKMKNIDLFNSTESQCN